MTGPEHYAEADELMVQLDSCDPDEPRWLGLCAAAQAHYSAALAAATALQYPGPHSAESRDQWASALPAENHPPGMT